MKTKKPKTTKQSKPLRKKPAIQTPNGATVGSRVFCVYDNARFPIDGELVAIIDFGVRAVVYHDEEVVSTFGWGRNSPRNGDTSAFKVWGAQYVFPIRK